MGSIDPRSLLKELMSREATTIISDVTTMDA